MLRLQSRSLFFTNLIFIIVINQSLLNAQNSATIQGKVIDTQSGNPIPEVNIELLGTHMGDVSDSSGTYQLLHLAAGTYSIRASRIGFEPQTIENIVLNTGESRIVDFSLKASPVKLPGVEIEAERLWEKYLTKASLIGVQRMRAREMANIPGSLDDPTRAVQIFSGVSGGGDYSGLLAVRGGSPNQNQVIMDGMVIPNPYRFRMAFGGGMSAINPNTTQDIYLHLGGFSAEYGNALSSILEIESRMGNRKHLRTQGSINFMDVNGLVEGPFPAGLGSYLFSVRRTYYDLIINKITNSSSVFPFFNEFKGKFSFDITKNNRINIHLTQNKEGTELNSEVSKELSITEKVKTRIASISWRRLQGEKWQFNTMFSYYRDAREFAAFEPDTSDTTIHKIGTKFAQINSTIMEEEKRIYEQLDAKLTNISFKEDIRYKTGEESWLKWGFSFTKLPSKLEFETRKSGFSYARVETPNSINFDKTNRYYATYFESSTRATDKLHLRLGARYDYSSLIDDGEFSPRMSLWYKLNAQTSLEAAWGIFYQYPNPMAIHTRNIPVNLSSNLDNISAEKAIHQTIGLERSLSNNLVAKLQIYYKDIDRLLLPVDEESYAPKNNGRGYSKGFEFVLEKRPSKQSRTNGVISYSYGNAKYRAIDNDEWFPFKYNRQHALTFLFNMRLTGNWNFSMLGQFASGMPYTDILGLRKSSGIFGSSYWEFLRGEKYCASFPAYRRLDARISYERRFGDRAFSFYLDFINLTNQKNVYEKTWELRAQPEGKMQATKRTIYMLPLIPSFGLSFRM